MSLNTTPDSYTKLLIHSDTSDGSTTFVDSSATGHTITTSGDPSHEDTTAKFGATSIYLDGSDYLDIASHDDFNMGIDDFTMDGWFNFSTIADNRGIMSIGTDITAGSTFGMRWSGTGLQVKGGGSTLTNLGAITNHKMSTGQWHHLVLQRRGGVTELFIDGKLLGSDSTSYTLTAQNIRLGHYAETPYFGVQYMDEFRISKGIARWSGNFTPPTRPYSIIDDHFHIDTDDIYDREIVVGGVDSYTKLLIHSDDVDGNTTFIDSSPSNHTITSSFVSHSIDEKKFGNSSLYLSGSAEYLSISASGDFNFGDGDFTIDMWYNLNGDGNQNLNLIANMGADASGWRLYREPGTGDAGSLSFGFGNDGSWVSTTVVTIEQLDADLNEWHHVAVTKTEGQIFRIFKDGSLIQTATQDTAITDVTSSLHIGRMRDAAYVGWYGYIDEVRISKGIARWTNDFVPPKRQYGEKGVISAEGGVGIGTNIAREAFHVNSGQRRLYTVTGDATGSLFSVNDKNGSVLLDVDNEGWVTKPKLPAFHVTKTTVQSNFALGSEVTVTFDSERFDQGNNFSSNTFTAPVTGKYHFDCNLRLDAVDNAADYYENRLVTSNNTYDAAIFDPDGLDSDPLYWTLCFSVLADMDAGDTAFVAIVQIGGTQQTDLSTSCEFSGHLVC